MKHFRRTLTVAFAVLAAAAPAWIATPAVGNFIDAHAALAAYFPLVSGLVYALTRAWQQRGDNPPGAGAPSHESKTMGAQ